MLSGNESVFGNTAFWEKTYNDNFARLCSRARWQLTNGNPVEAEDTVTEAFVRAMSYVKSPDTIGSPFRYLWTTVTRVWTAQQIKSNRIKTIGLDDLDGKTLESLPAVQVKPEVLSMLEKDEFMRELRIKLGPLSLEEETLLELRLENYSWAEIATQLGEDLNRTKFRWYRFVVRQRYRLAKEKAKTQASS